MLGQPATPKADRPPTRGVHADGLRVATPEALIPLKRIANRAKDQIDLLGLLALRDIDWTYVERRAREWEVASLLAELRARVPG